MTAALGSLLALCACGRAGLDPVATPPSPIVSATGRSAAGLPPEAGPGTEPTADDGKMSLPDSGKASLPADAQASPLAGGEASVPDGRYSGLSILTAFHGDCNAGGTGEMLVSGRMVSYRDARNPVLSGMLGPHGEVDLEAGSTRLAGHFAAAVFTGRIAGGACEYQMRFERVPG